MLCFVPFQKIVLEKSGILTVFGALAENFIKI